MKPTNHDPQLPFADAEPPAAVGRRLRDAAVKKVHRHAAPGFLEAADRAAERAARELEYLTVDDLWLAMAGDAKTHDNRAMGPVMTRAKKRGLIEPTDQFRPSTQPSCHANPRRIWRSLVCQK